MKLFWMNLYLVASHDPNKDLVLANNGMHLGVNDSLNRRILSDRANYNNVFGKDPELERNARNMRMHLSHYKNENNPTVEEWLNIKNLAVSAIRGECRDVEKLFENHIIPRDEYERLMQRCGKPGIDQKIHGHLEMMRAQEMAGDTMAHANMNHLREHAAMSHIDDHVISGDVSNHMHSGKGISHGINTLDSSKGVMDSVFDEPSIRRGAFNFLSRNLEPLKDKLAHMNTSFTREVIDRINKTKKIAEDVVNGMAGAGEKYLEIGSENEEFTSKMLGHGEMDEQIRNALDTSDPTDRLRMQHITIDGHVDGHSAEELSKHIYDDHSDNHLHCHAEEHNHINDHNHLNDEHITNHIDEHSHINDHNHINDEHNHLNDHIVEDEMHHDDINQLILDKHILDHIKEGEGNNIQEELLKAGHRLKRAAEEIDQRAHEAEVKIIQAEEKAKYAEDKIKEAQLTEEQKQIVDRLKGERERMNKLQSEEEKEIDRINEKKHRYERLLKEKNLDPKNIEDLNQLKDAFDEIKEKNRRIVEEEKREKERAEREREHFIVHPHHPKPLEITNSENNLSTEKKNARIVEEQMAKNAEEEEIREARSIAAQNVKRLGGTDEQAGIEADRAEKVKRKLIEKKKMERAEVIRDKLIPQIGEIRALKEAEHIAATHNGRNPIGNSLEDLKEHFDFVGLKNEEKKRKENMSIEEQLGIIKLIPDDVTQISADNCIIELPLVGIPDAKAKTIEEDKIKKDLENLRDNIRNKVTKKKFNSGLVTIQGVEGYLNLPESCKEIEINKGMAYFDRAGYENMVAQKIDTTPLEPVYSRGEEPLFYRCKIKDMKMKIPSVLNTNPQKLLYNDFESINIGYAKKIEVVNGEVICESWSKFSSRIRPRVYKGVERSVDEVPESVKDEFERIESLKDGMHNTNVKTLKNPDGTIMAEIKPDYGIKSNMKITDAIRKADEMKKTRPEMKIPDLNVGDENEDYTGEFIRSVEKDLRTKKGRPEVLNENNGIEDKVSETIKKLGGGSSSDLINNYRRKGNDEETKVFNYLVENCEEEGANLNMKKEDFLDSLSKMDHKTISDLLKFYFDVSKSVDFQKKLTEIDQKDFSGKIKECFPRKNPSEIVKEFFKAFSRILNGPDKIERPPITQYVTSPQSKKGKDRMKNCAEICKMKDCADICKQIPPYGVVQLSPVQKLITPENIVLNQAPNPLIHQKNRKVPPKPLSYCKLQQNTGCIVAPIPFMERQPQRGRPNMKPVTFNNNLHINQQ